MYSHRLTIHNNYSLRIKVPKQIIQIKAYRDKINNYKIKQFSKTSQANKTPLNNSNHNKISVYKLTNLQINLILKIQVKIIRFNNKTNSTINLW